MRGMGGGGWGVVCKGEVQWWWRGSEGVRGWYNAKGGGGLMICGGVGRGCRK